MAETHQVRSPAWLAFLAGAVAMLVIVLLVLAWNATRTALTDTLTMGLRRPDLSLPTTPPPEGPRMPRPPVPTPR